MTPRASLRDRLAAARRENYIDLRCTTPAFKGIHVRCSALSSEQVDEATEAATGKSAGIAMAVHVLVSSCVGIWEEVDGKGVSPVEGFDGKVDLDSGEVTGRLPKFSDPELAAALGVDAEGTAAAAVRALLAPNSDLRLISYADELTDFSSGANEQIRREAPGNS